MIKLETAAPPNSNIPIEAVVLHGHGEAALDHYRRYRAFLAITRAFLALDAAWQSELDGTLIGQGHSILSWVGALPVAAIIEHTETIAFSSWLQELEFRLIQARDREAAERMLDCHSSFCVICRRSRGLHSGRPNFWGVHVTLRSA